MKQPQAPWTTPSPALNPQALRPLSLAVLLAISLSACGNSDDSSPADSTSTPAPTVVTGCELDGSTGGAVVVLPGDPGAPEIATGYAPKSPGYSRTYMAITNNPSSTKVACEILKQGGTAVDAAVAAQMVLNLVEPQSSGIGGGSFIMYYNAADKTVTAYDGRETAPAASDENYLQWISTTNKTTPLPNAVRSGRSIGTPGTLRVLELAHKENGRLPWKDLFTPAIKIATDGFAIPPRMAASIQSSTVVQNIKRDAEMAAYFLDESGNPRKVNTLLKNPALAATFTAVAEGGADAFYKDGPIARAIVAKIQTTYDGNTTPGTTTLADLAAYEAKKRTAICSPYRDYEVCGMPPPSSGGLAVAQTLGILESFNLAQYAPTSMDGNGGKPSVMGVHLVASANHLAYADRNKYVADTDFVPLPGGSPERMLNKTYLAQRAQLIPQDKALTLPTSAGDLSTASLASAPLLSERGTTHLSLVDRYGNVVSMTTTIEAGLGSYHFTNGFLLNNQLTDFNAAPTVDGVAVANRFQAGKRPRSSMAPTLVFKRNADGSRGAFVMATGSPGGASIIQYVTKTLVGVLDWKMDAQQAVSMIDFGGNNSSVMVGGEHPNVDISVPTGGVAGDNDPLVSGLRKLGHPVSVTAQSSGLSAIVAQLTSGSTYYVGGADPRREGIVLGDTFKP